MILRSGTTSSVPSSSSSPLRATEARPIQIRPFGSTKRETGGVGMESNRETETCGGGDGGGGDGEATANHVHRHQDNHCNNGSSSGGEEAEGGGGGGGGGGGVTKWKSCKGYMYYSAYLKAHGIQPRCVGIPRSLSQVPVNVGESEIRAQDVQTLTNFYFGCAGYSVYLNKDQSTEKQTTTAGLPLCIFGLKLLVTEGGTDNTSAPAHVHTKDGRELPQSQTQPQPLSQTKPAPANSGGSDFFSRYKRNANLVASEVVRNLKKVGIYIKDSVDDMLYPYRRRPK